MMQSSKACVQREEVCQLRLPSALEKRAAGSASLSRQWPTDNCRQQLPETSARGVHRNCSPAWAFGSGKSLKPDDVLLCPSSTLGVPLETIQEEPAINAERETVEQARRSVSRDVTPEYRPGFQDYTTTLNGAIARTLLRSGGGHTNRV
mmetsp:Transcript_152872/g.281802  ORF Transcript_152872/g.281802 Transcript_152872/m.281802 type:complete len:149 (-) Transcript_152872:70-516(-)